MGHGTDGYERAALRDRAIERAGLPCEVFVDGPAVRIDAVKSCQSEVIFVFGHQTQ